MDGGGLPGVAPAIRSAWERAEAALYGTAMSQPAAYQRAVLTVGRVRSALVRESADLPALLARYQGEEAAGWPLASAEASSLGVPVAGLDLAHVTAAACALAGRAIAAGRRDAARRARITQAAAHGGWTVVEESGDAEGSPWSPYLRIEVRAGTAVGLMVTTEPDDDLLGVVHRVRTVVVDAGTGQVRTVGGRSGGDGPPDAQSEHADAVARERAVTAVKAGLDSRR